MRVAIYARVSTRDKGQDPENQFLQLRQFCAAQGWQIVHEYLDHESGGKADRSQFQTMLRDAATRQFDLALFWALDRFTREGTLATLKYLELLEGYGVRWRSLTEPWIDSAGPFRDVIISLLASLAKQERLRISERVRAGLERARKEGKQLGRRRTVFDRAKAVRLRAEGVSWSRIARRLGITVSAARRAVRQQVTAPGPVLPGQAADLSPESPQVRSTAPPAPLPFAGA
jgi:DNA invertase Pin-like site-specific DNA recombinase